MITEAADGTEIPPGKLPAATAPAEPKAEPKPGLPSRSRKAEAKPKLKKPEARAESKPEPKAVEAAKARALLEGKSPAATPTAAKPAATTTADENGRFVVQVGAFADADKAKEVRQKLERAGLKNYTNVAETKNGTRIRVRAGPFASKAEADKAAEKIKGLSLPAAILSL